MLNTLKPHVQSLFGLRSAESKERFTMRGTQSSTHEILNPVKNLDYKAVCSVILITEVNTTGDETPVAIAFINKKSSGVIVKLHQLGEVE